MNKPFFSIVIPTYNRCKDLKGAIAIILNQTFKDFELIISDNASTDDTQKIVKSFKDKRIKYFRNPKNIGGEKNYQKVFSYTRGEYIFSMGDDDFILFEDTLQKIKNILKKEKYGLLRINLIEKKLIGQGLRKSIILFEKDIQINKNATAEKIIEFCNKAAVGHIAGLVIKNSKNIGNKINDCSVYPWIRAVYDEIKNSGAYFLSSHYMVITWSMGEILNHYDVPPNNRLMFEKYTNFIFPLINKNNLKTYKLKYYQGYIKMQPVIKLYSNNKNLIKFDQRLLKLEPRLKRNPLFWLMAGMAFFLPRFVWKIVRVIQHKSKNTLDLLSNKNKIYNRFELLDGRYFQL